MPKHKLLNTQFEFHLDLGNMFEFGSPFEDTMALSFGATFFQNEFRAVRRFENGGGGYFNNRT